MTIYYIPDVGATGVFDLLPPFDTMVAPKERYTVKAVRTISDYLSQNEDVKVQVYELYNIASVYTEHEQEDISILSIRSEKGHWLYVPVSYVKSYPLVNGIPYRGYQMVVSLAAVPTTTDFTSLETQLSDVVKGTLGFVPRIKLVEVTKVFQISSDAHLAKQIERATVREAGGTPAMIIAKLQADLAATQAQNQALTDYIQANMPPGP